MGLKIHTKNVHSKTGANATLEEKYHSTRNYWRTGYLGTVYQTFLDANDVVEAMNLSEEETTTEKSKILEARKTAFSPGAWHNFPPWSR